ncbi:MAG: serine hydrolase [Desulfurococcaceae archaeon]
MSSSEVGKLEEFILKKLSKYRMPSLVIALSKRGELVYQRCFGFKDVESSLPPTPRTNYGIGSVTKAFTALAIMQLQERGLLSVDDPVNKYVDIFKTNEVRIHHLLTHTSGIPALGYAEALIDSYYELGGPWLPVSNPDDVLVYMRSYESWITFKPGERWFYLNEGYVVLGKIIEKASGLKYEDYVKKNILEPIGMDKSYFTREEYVKDPDKATPYKVQDNKLVRAEPVFGISADGGLFSNVVDLLKFTDTLINRGSRRGVNIVGRESVELMEKPHVKLPYESPTSRYYGYGLIVHDDFHGRKLVGHSGSVYVYTAYLGYLPSEGVAVAVLSNSSGYPLSLIGAYALTLELGYNPDEKLNFVKVEKVLERIEGTYAGYMNSVQLRVKATGGSLVIEDPYRKTQIPAFPERIEDNYALYYVHGVTYKLPVEFYIDASGVTMVYERYVLRKIGSS